MAFTSLGIVGSMGHRYEIVPHPDDYGLILYTRHPASGHAIRGKVQATIVSR